MFERETGGPWKSRGTAKPVRLGSAGLAWDSVLPAAQRLPGPHKIEGDKKAPAGVFDLLFCFGYSGQRPSTKMRYLPITEETVAVDDPNSHWYGQVLQASTVAKPDWRHAEKMKLADDRYKWGVVVNYNYFSARPGAGSCIFLHVWKNQATTTVGCTAMAEPVILDLIKWLDAGQHPVLIQMPLRQYADLAGPAGFPILTLPSRSDD